MALLYIIVGVALAMGVANGFEQCGIPRGCVCSAPVLHTIQCSNITVFPLIDALLTYGVVSVRLYNTQLIELPLFPEEEWPVLNEVVLRNNTLLDCQFDAQRKDITIDSDCTAPEKKNKRVGQSSTILGSIASVFAILTIIGAFAKKRCKYSFVYM